MLGQLHRQLDQIKNENTPAGAVYGARTNYIRNSRRVVFGPRFYCPICKKWYRNFLPFGLNQRPNARCPGCDSLERHRFLWLYLTNYLQLTRRRAKVLHIAPEKPIRFILEQLPNLTYTTVDLYDREAGQNMDLTNLTFNPEMFDVVICSHVLEHIKNDRLAMSEMARVLRPNGRAIILVPTDFQLKTTYEDDSITTPSKRLIAFGHPYHVRICGTDYSNRLHEAGFNVDKVYSSSLTPHRRRILRINKNILYDCLQPGQMNLSNLALRN